MSSADEKLCRAAICGDVAEIERLIAAGADPNALMNGYAPLQEAAARGHVAVIAALVKAGARVDGANRHGSTPLMWAAGNGRTAAVGTLVAAGANVHRASEYGDTALHYASSNGSLDAARVLLEAGAKADVRNKRGKWPIDVVSVALSRSMRPCQAAATPRWLAQVGGSETTRAAIHTLLASAPPWSRRRPVAVACYSVEWEWEA
jgi:ankyrin repeat protein